MIAFRAHSVVEEDVKCKYFSLHGINNYVNFGNTVNGEHVRAHMAVKLWRVTLASS